MCVVRLCVGGCVVLLCVYISVCVCVCVCVCSSSESTLGLEHLHHIWECEALRGAFKVQSDVSLMFEVGLDHINMILDLDQNKVQLPNEKCRCNVL